MRKYFTAHLVKSEDLNHHGTLFAARAASWFVEAGFMTAACEHKNPAEIVCRNVHGMSFTAPIQNGDIVHFDSTVVRVGKTSITVHIVVSSERTKNIGVEGFITFVIIDKDTGEKKPHGIVLDEAKDDIEKEARIKAAKLFAK
jgi:acyl-CoA hydrolase